MTKKKNRKERINHLRKKLSDSHPEPTQQEQAYSEVFSPEPPSPTNTSLRLDFGEQVVYDEISDKIGELLGQIEGLKDELERTSTEIPTLEADAAASGDAVDRERFCEVVQHVTNIADMFNYIEEQMDALDSHLRDEKKDQDKEEEK